MEAVIITKNKQKSFNDVIVKHPIDINSINQIEYDTHGVAEMNVIDQFIYDTSICKCELCYTITHLDVIKSFCSSSKQYLIVIEEDEPYYNNLNDILYRLSFEYTFDVCILNKDYDYFFNEYQKNLHFNMFYDNDYVTMKSYVITKHAARKILDYYTDASVYKYVIQYTIYDLIKKTKVLSEVITPQISSITNLAIAKDCVKKTPLFLHVKVVGSIGKRLFQIATAYSICKELNHVLYLDVNESKEKYDYAYYWFKVNNTNFINKTFTVEWTDLDKITFKPSLIQKCHNKNVYLEGSFCTGKYFIKYKDELTRILSPNDHLKFYFSKVYGCLDDFIFLYIPKRSSNKINLLKTFYYQKAIEYMMDKGFSKILLFSSVDPTTLDFLADLDYILVEENKLISIQLMSMCGRGGICSNSLISWWGGWLNGNEIVFPNVWFKNTSETSDLYFDNVRVLKVI